MITKSTVNKLAQERIDELDNGLFIVDLAIEENNKIRVEIDGMNGVGINDCVSISRNIEHNLDREKEDFELEVTSASLSNPFKTKQQYVKNIGKEIKVKTQTSKIEGILKEVNNNYIIVETKHKERIEGRKKKQLIITDNKIDTKDILETKIVISFKK